MPHDEHRSAPPNPTPGPPGRKPHGSKILCARSVLLIAVSGTAVSTAAVVSADSPANGPEQRPAQLWAADAATTEISILNHGQPYFRYRMHLIDHRGDQVRDEIETHDGTVARLILRDGHPLTPEEDAAERARLNALIASPDDFFKHIHNERSERKTAVELIQLLPEAMLYTYVPGQPQLPVNGGRRQVVLDYEPNPHWSPPSTTSSGLTGLRGRIWIDSDTHTTVRMDGTIFRPVNFGWGMLAHIYPGGTLSLEQNNPGGGQRWIYTHFEQAITVRALMVKSLEIRSKVDASGFQAVPDMGYADAIRVLLNTPLPTH